MKKIDVLGQKFNKLTVVCETIKDNTVAWVCKCECGNKIITDSYSLRSGHTKSCGCLQKLNLIGNRYGKLIVIKEITKNKKSLWLCQCDCGNSCTTSTRHLRKGDTKSCGCLVRETASRNFKKYNDYDLSGEYGIGYTQKGQEFYFDLEDYDKIKCFYWSLCNGYVMNTQKPRIQIHRLVMDCINGVGIDIDHINHNTYDNRKSNLRICTRQQNSFNSRVKNTNTSGFKGVCWHKQKNKWRAYIMVGYKQIHLGLFDTPEDATKTRLQAEEKYFGEYRYKGGDYNGI